MEKDDRFPAKIFAVYVIFYAGQAMYNTYLNLFMRSLGMSLSQIGQLQAASTVLLILIQPVWGAISDRSKSKNRVLGMLMLAAALVCLSYYMFATAVWMAICVMLFSAFFFPAMTLQDNYTLELLDNSRWDFGNIRLGGTVGYSVCALIAGFIIGTNYSSVFVVMAVFMAIAGASYFALPRVEGHRKKREKMQYGKLLKDMPLVCMLIFNITYTMGTTFFHQFYPVYFTEELHAGSQLLGALTFFTAMSEVPFFWFARKLEQRFGAEKVMLFAGASTAVRWLILFFVTDPLTAIFVNLLSGCGYVGFSYCLIKYINQNAPSSMKATAQSLNAILAIVFSKIIFIPLGGWLSGLFGFRSMLLTACAFSVIGIVFFRVSFRRAMQIKQAENDSTGG